MNELKTFVFSPKTLVPASLTLAAIAATWYVAGKINTLDATAQGLTEMQKELLSHSAKQTEQFEEIKKLLHSIDLELVRIKARR